MILKQYAILETRDELDRVSDKISEAGWELKINPSDDGLWLFVEVEQMDGTVFAFTRDRHVRYYKATNEIVANYEPNGLIFAIARNSELYMMLKLETM